MVFKCLYLKEMFRKLSEKFSRMISFRVSNLLGTIGVQFREIGNDIKVNKYKHSFDYKVVCTMHYAVWGCNSRTYCAIF